MASPKTPAEQSPQPDTHVSDVWYQSLVECLPQNIFRKDKYGRVTFANQRYCATLNRPLSELLGKTDFDLFPLALAEKYVADDHKVLQSGDILETVEDHLLPDGRQIFVQVVKIPVRDPDGEVIGTQGIFWDVTDRKRAEMALQESELRYRQLAEAIQDGIVVADQDGNITIVNPAATQMFGYEADEAIGQPLSFLMPDQFDSSHLPGLSHFVKTPEGRLVGKTVEVQGKRKSGESFPLEMVLSVFRENTGEGKELLRYLATLRDVTERNQMRRVLAQQEKLASIGLLSAGIAHEINNPIAFVSNNLAVLDRECRGLLKLADFYHRQQDLLAAVDTERANTAKQMAEQIDLDYLREQLPSLLNRTYDGVTRVANIVDSLRSLARTDSATKHDIYLPEVIESCLEILRGKLRRAGVAIEQQHDQQLRVSCVPSQINQVVGNLLVNALHAIQRIEREHHAIQITTKRIGGEVLLQVRDTGAGIAEEHLAKIFDPFFTTKDVGEGTGLGLSISHNIVTAHSGRIEVESEPGTGSCFSVYLPRSDSENDSSA